MEALCVHKMKDMEAICTAVEAFCTPNATNRGGIVSSNMIRRIKFPNQGDEAPDLSRVPGSDMIGARRSVIRGNGQHDLHVFSARFVERPKSERKNNKSG